MHLASWPVAYRTPYVTHEGVGLGLRPTLYAQHQRTVLLLHVRTSQSAQHSIRSAQARRQARAQGLFACVRSSWARCKR